MKRVHSHRETFFGWTALWLVIMFVTATGCGSLPKAAPAGEQVQSLGPESGSASWAEGLSAFEREDYQEATKIFGALSKNATTGELRRKALYALACTRLMMAQNRDDFNAAWNLLELWSQTAPVNLNDEDPRMLTPVLSRFAPTTRPAVAPFQSAVQPSGVPNKAASISAIKVVKDKECEKQLRESDKEVQRLKKQIKTLRHQLEALETIHRNIQEKKKEVSNP
jgi:hypothetical protein